MLLFLNGAADSPSIPLLSFLKKDDAFLNLLCHQLETNQLTKVAFGFARDYASLYADDDAVNRLCTALYRNKSLKQVTIGPRLLQHQNQQNPSDPFRQIFKLLDAISSIPSLQQLDLNLQTIVPENVLTRCLEHVCCNTIQLSLTRVCQDPSSLSSSSSSSSPSSMTTSLNPACSNNSNGTSITANSINPEQQFLVFLRELLLLQPSTVPIPSMKPTPSEIHMMPVLLPHMKHLNRLRLISCDIGDDDVLFLYNYCKRHDLILQEVSLEGNGHTLSAAGIHFATLLPTQRLDLTECNVCRIGFKALIRHVKSNPMIQELVLAWNAHLVESGILPELANEFVHRKLLDISCCNVGNAELDEVVSILVEHENSCTLETLAVRGCAEELNGTTIQRLLLHNSSLKQLFLYHSHFYLPCIKATLREICLGLESNFTMETLTVLGKTIPRDCIPEIQALDLYLRLNRAGRRIVLNQSSPISSSNKEPNKEELAFVLANIAHDLNGLFWMLRNGAGLLSKRN